MNLKENKNHNSLVFMNLTELRLINIFFIGLITYSIGFSLASTSFVNFILCNIIQLLGVAMFLPSSLLLLDFKIDAIYFKTLIFLYIFYLNTIVLRGFSFDYYYIKETIIDGWYGIFIYLTPLCCLFPIKVSVAKKIFDSINIFSVLFVFLVLVFSPILFSGGGQEVMAITENFSRTLGISAGFVLLTFPYHSHKINALAIFSLSLVLLIATFQARRGLMLYCALIILFAGILYLANGKNRSVIIIFSLMVFSSATLIGTEIFNKTDLFFKLNERGLEDTRSNVETRFFEDMTELDWIIGKGINGQYFSPGIVWNGEVSVYRSIIETDYLQIILKGGFISLGLLLLIMIPAAFLGIFYSNNILSKAAGIWIFIGVVNMYPSTVNTFTLNYILVWYAVGICYSNKFRRIDDEIIYNYFKNIKKTSSK